MDNFLARFAALVTGTLSGFDRLVFRGTLIPLVRKGGMFNFLSRSGVRLLDFKPFALSTSERVKEAALAEAQRHDRPVRYLESCKTNKEELARSLLAQHPLTKPGVICAFKTVEPCMTFEYHRSPDANQRGLRLRPHKCLHVYQYFLHPTFGFMNARIETWFPFNVQICLNGREWLAQQLRRRCSPFKQSDNCMTWLGNPELARRLMKEQLETDWPARLTSIARRLNPHHTPLFEAWPMDYYWSAYQTEWATDVVFKDPRSLESLYPTLVRHAVHHFKSPDVMRFLGRKAHGNFTGEITTSFKDRPEGVRVKHWVRGNSVKMYDKAGSVLRIETTIAQTADFKVLRPTNDDVPDAPLAWMPLRKGVADLHRRAELSQRSNERYLEALSAVEDTTPCAHLFDAIARSVVQDGRRFRALRIGDPDDIRLLETIARGEFATAGFRNRDISRLTDPGSPSTTAAEKRRRAARVSRRLRLLRAHGLIRKIPKTHRYFLNERGQLLAAALFAARGATVKKLLDLAA